MRPGKQERFAWRDAFICGLLLGVVITLMVSLNQPIAQLRPQALMRFIATMLCTWCLFGLATAFGLKLVEDYGRLRLLAPVVLLAAWMIAVMFSCASGRDGPGNFGRGLERVSVLDLATYDAWVTLFYGTFYAAAYFASRRTQRLRKTLASLRAARDEAEAALREARLHVVRGQMQPSMLLDALSALQRSYALGRLEGERLFDLIIAFLRAAMPGLRSGASTLEAELAVIDRYAALRGALNVGPPAWRLDRRDPTPVVAFPPLRLLPALDRISRAAPLDASIVVTTERASDAFVLRVDVAASATLPLALRQRLRSGMRRDLGSEAMVAIDIPGSVIAELHFKPPAPSAIGLI